MAAYYVIGFLEEPPLGLMDYSDITKLLHLTILPKFSLPSDKVEKFLSGLSSVTTWLPPVRLNVLDHTMFGEDGDVPVALVSSGEDYSLHDLHNVALDALVKNGGWGYQEHFMGENYAPHISYYNKWAPVLLTSLSLVRHSGDRGEIVENLKNLKLEG